jgi:hypothetical protein
VTDRRSAGLSEFTWYSRLATWIGAAMLLVQSVLGRDAGPVTVLAVLLLAIGFLCFLVGLAVDSHVPAAELLIGPASSQPETQRAPAEQPSTPTNASPASVGADVAAKHSGGTVAQKQAEPGGRRARSENSPVVAGPPRRPKFRERAKRADARPTDRPETGSERARPADTDLELAATPLETSAGPVITEMLTAGETAIGRDCPRCGSALQVGQLAATCPVCGRTHHAVCWMEHQFHCAAPNCTGHGSLEAPSAAPT